MYHRIKFITNLEFGLGKVMYMCIVIHTDKVFYGGHSQVTYIKEYMIKSAMSSHIV